MVRPNMKTYQSNFLTELVFESLNPSPGFLVNDFDAINFAYPAIQCAPPMIAKMWFPRNLCDEAPESLGGGDRRAVGVLPKRCTVKYQQRVITIHDDLMHGRQQVEA